MDAFGSNESTLMLNHEMAQERSTDNLISTIIFVMFFVTFVIGEGNLGLLIILCVKRIFDPIRTALVVSLTVSNALLIHSSIFAMIVMKKRTWTFGPTWCTVYWMTEQSNKYASVFSLAALCVDNFIVVVFATRAKAIRTTKYVATAIGFIWGSSLLLLTPIILYTKIYDYHVVKMCVIVWPKDVNESRGQAEAAYLYSSFSSAYVIPLILMSVLYSLTLRKLFQQSKCLRQSYTATTILIILLAGGYFFCWTPYWVLNFLASRNAEHSHAELFAIKIAIRFLTMLPYVNSAVYPYTYLLLPRNRQAIARLCRLCSRHEQLATTAK